jgi:aminoglycoside/choline kinase family phosphotransferase
VRFYDEVLGRTTVRTPTCYFAQLEDDNHLLLLEDLGDYRIGSQAVGATLEDAQLAIDELARLHAPFWEHVDDLSWVPHIAGSYHAETMLAMANAGWDNMVAVFAEHFTDAVTRSRDRILAAIPAMQSRMDSAPVTFTHGDFRMDNLLFGTRSDQIPVVILDWQGPLLSRGVVDVALLLGQNTLIEVRRAHERELLQAYVDALSALGVDYPIASAWEHYLDALAYQWCYAATVTGSLDSSNPRSKAWMSQLIARQVAATEDHRLLARLDTFQ